VRTGSSSSSPTLKLARLEPSRELVSNVRGPNGELLGNIPDDVAIRSGAQADSDACRSKGGARGVGDRMMRSPSRTSIRNAVSYSRSEAQVGPSRLAAEALIGMNDSVEIHRYDHGPSPGKTSSNLRAF